MWASFGEYFVGGLGPDEGLAAVVTALDEGADLGDEVFDRSEGAAVDGLVLDDPEPGLDQVHSDRLVPREVHLDARVGRQPVADLGAFVGSVVVHHQVQLDRSAVSSCAIGLSSGSRTVTTAC